MGRTTATALLVLSLLPSAYLAWQGRDLPHLGSFHDDAIYLETARNLATNQSYTIGSLPWTPAQTKYPPLYPLYLSIAWRLTPELASALPIAMFLNWLWLPIWLFGLRRLGVPLAIPILIALHPEVQLAATRLMSDLMFAALVTWSLAWAQPAVPIVAYLTRTAALPLIAGMALADMWARQYRKAFIQLAVAAIPIVGWASWVATHRHPASTAVERYYTDYFAYQLEMVPWAQLPTHLYQQLDPFFAALSQMVLLNHGWVMLNRLAAIAIVSGIVRLMRSGQHRAYGCYGLLASLMMLAWYFPPDTRALLPLLPLILLGFAAESMAFARVLQGAWAKRGADRVFAVAIGLACAALPLVMISHAQSHGNEVFVMERRFLADTRQAYQWIATHTPPHATFFTVDDPVFTLYTGRKAVRLPKMNEIYLNRRPSPQTLATMEHFHLDCLFVSIKHFDPDPNHPHQPLDFSVDGSGLKVVYRTPTELVACRH